MASPETRRYGPAEVRWIMAWVVSGYLAALSVGAICAWLLTTSGTWSDGLAWERELLLSMETRLPAAIDRIMLVLPWLGTNLTLMPMTIVAAFWLFGRGRRDMAVHLVVVQVGTYTLNVILKFIFDRPRPELWEWRGQFAWASYPSGHAIASVAVPFTIAYLLHRELGWRWPYVAASVLLAITAYSRLYLGVHWPSDVLAGLAMGAIWLAATMIAFRRRPRSRVAKGTHLAETHIS